MSIQMGADHNIDALDFEQEDKVLSLLDKFDGEIGALKEKFYSKKETGNYPGIYIFSDLEDQFFSTNDTDDLSLSVFKLLGKLSEKNGDRTPGFSFGQEGFSLEFYKELKNLIGGNEITLYCTVSGGGNGYYDVSYELQSDGWNIYADFYEDSEDEDW